MNSHRSRRVALTLLLIAIAALTILDVSAGKTETTVTGIVKAAEMYGTKVRSVYIRAIDGDEFLVVRGTTVGKQLLREVGATVQATGYVRESRARNLDFSNAIDVLEYKIVPDAAEAAPVSAE